MAAKPTRLTHIIAIQLHQEAESYTVCSSRSRRTVRKLLDTPSYVLLKQMRCNWTHRHVDVRLQCESYSGRRNETIISASSGVALWREQKNTAVKGSILSLCRKMCSQHIPRISMKKYLATWSRVLEKLIITQPIKKFPAFYGTKRFITVFTRVRHWFLSWARWIESTLPHHICLSSILILSSYPQFMSCKWSLLKFCM